MAEEDLLQAEVLQELPQHGQVLGEDLLDDNHGLEGLLHLVVRWVLPSLVVC